MKDTGFSGPPASLGRLATGYSPVQLARSWCTTNPTAVVGPPALPIRSRGLVSTVDDYLAFGKMLRTKGAHGGRRILSRPSGRDMTSDQLTPRRKLFPD